MIELRPQQQQPLEVVGASVALGAGAGCGKTTVLTERFLRALQSPGGLGSVIALTFTEKAARELRGRVRRASRDRIGESFESDWSTIVRGLEAAPIGTFHGFCQGLLSRYPIEAGVEPGFGIVDEAIAPSLRNRAISRRIRSWLSDGRDDLVTLAVEYGLDALRDLLANLVAGRDADALAEWAERDEDEILRLWEAAWEANGRVAILDRFVKDSHACRSLLLDHQCSHPKMSDRRSLILGAFDDLQRSSDPASQIEMIREAAKVQGGGKADDWDSPEAYETIKEEFTSLRERCKKTRDAVAWDREASRNAATLGRSFARLAVEARAAYDQEKRSAGLLDFDDLILKARDLLRGHAERVRADLMRDGDVILVDEFQDTDPVQGEILRRLAGDGLGDGRLFLVGDRKQSIYRFRGARPQIFREFRDEFPEAGHLHLTENFRSLPGVLAFVNALFRGEFDDPSLMPGAPPEVAPHGSSVIYLAPPTLGDDAPKANAGERRRGEARRLANLVAGRLARGWMVYDRGTKTHRPAGPGDVAFLFRTLSDLAVYESALTDAGLDFHVVGGSAFFAQQEIIDVINLLAAIDDPLDALSLAAVLRSPFFAVSDDGLYWLASSVHVQGPLGDFVASFRGAANLSRLSPDDRDRVQRARRLLDGWRAARDRMPMADLLDRALAESGYEPALMGERLGDRKRANVRKLVGLVRRFDLQGGWTLADVVARLREDLRKPPREDQAATGDEAGDSVRLMTIHQAKGLEFPITVLPDLGRELQDDRSSVAFDRELGVVIRPASEDGDPNSARGTVPSLGWTIHREVERAEDRLEAIRLFYVATTRAESVLVLSTAELPEVAGARSPALQLLDARFDLTTGRAVDAGDEETALIEIIDAGPDQAGESRGWPGRPEGVGRLEVAAILRSTPLVPHDPPVEPAYPEILNLDVAARLPSTAARLDRLVRAVLARSDGIVEGSWNDVLVEESRRQSPAASSGIRHRAEGRIARFLDEQLELVRGLVRPSRVVERAWDWQIAHRWPGDGPLVLIRGRADWIVKTKDGGLAVVLLGDSRTGLAFERLRLIGAAMAAEAAGLGRVVRGWSVPIAGDEPGPAEVGFSPAALDAALAEFREESARTGIEWEPTTG